MIKSIIYSIIVLKNNIKEATCGMFKFTLLRTFLCLMLINQWRILCSDNNARSSNNTYSKELFIKEDDDLSNNLIYESKFKGQNSQDPNVQSSSAQRANASLVTPKTNRLPSKISVTEYNFYYLSSKINEILNTTIPGLFKACREMKDLHAKINDEIIEIKRKDKNLTFLKIIEQIFAEKQTVYFDFEEKINDLRSNAEKLNLIYKKAVIVYQKIKTSLCDTNLDVVGEHNDFITMKIFDEEERLSKNLITVKKTFQEDKKQADTIFKILSKLLILKPIELKNDIDVEILISSSE